MVRTIDESIADAIISHGAGKEILAESVCPIVGVISIANEVADIAARVIAGGMHFADNVLLVSIIIVRVKVVDVFVGVGRGGDYVARVHVAVVIELVIAIVHVG